MDKKHGTQTIIITGNKEEARFQIIIPPFRPINMFELEDNFKMLTKEIENSILDDNLSSAMIEFITAFKNAIEKENVVPLVEYFVNHEVKNMGSQEMKLIFDSVREYINYSTDEDRLMN